jgi:hypothetical protein
MIYWINKKYLILIDSMALSDKILEISDKINTNWVFV